MPDTGIKSAYGYEETLTGGTVYRAAFPAYRVFIYGQEVTNDVLSVRANNSGGSAERTAGSCAITLNNHEERYTVSYADIVAIAEKNAALEEYRDGEMLRSEFDEAAEFTHLDEETFDALASTLHSQGLPENADDAEQASQNVRKSLMDYKEREHDRLSYAHEAETRWGEIKRAVFDQKLAYKSFIRPSIEDDEFWLSDKEKQERQISDYFYQQGDCIFHPNDPVRVAFRDPYDPRIWYWMFAGFVDSYTEDSDVNKVSTVTITCTDVSKMARYAMIQLNTGGLDPNVEQYFQGDGEGEVAEAKIQAYQELFRGFTIPEILETIFFGSASTLKSITQTTLDELNAMSDAEIKSYLMTQMKMTKKEVEQVLGRESRGYATSPADFAGVFNKIFEHKTEAKKQLDVLNMAAVTSPRGVSFKRRSQDFGLHYYYYQFDEVAPTTRDKVSGTGVVDLNQWNEVIHHRVRESDLEEMLLAEDEEFFSDEDLLDRTPRSDNPGKYSIDDVITMIGTNTADYPVGHGRVFYFAPATLNSVLGDVLERGFGGSISMNSAFRDRLSYIYDVAELVDFRFYATPKGDLVFEMPFYDFDTGAFLRDGVSDREDVNKQYLPNYTELFGKLYDGTYTLDTVKELSKMTFDLVVNDADLQLYDFDQGAIFDWARTFTIEEHEQTGFSNTATDEGVITLIRTKHNYFKNLSAADQSAGAREFQIVPAKPLIPILGVRPYDTQPKGFIQGPELAKLYAALEMNRMNAEARNASVPIVANFGLMANRPVYWRKRNYQANIVSLQHSIVWNSSVDTTVNLNQIRGWAGKLDEQGKPVYQHFGADDRPFNLASLLRQGQAKGGKK